MNKIEVHAEIDPCYDNVFIAEFPTISTGKLRFIKIKGSLKVVHQRFARFQFFVPEAEHRELFLEQVKERILSVYPEDLHEFVDFTNVEKVVLKDEVV